MYWLTVEFLEIPGLFALFLVCVIMQAAAISKMTGAWKWAAWVLAVPTILIVLYSLFCLVMQSNLWPILMLFYTPYLFLVVAGFWVLWGLCHIVISLKNSENSVI